MRPDSVAVDAFWVEEEPGTEEEVELCDVKIVELFSPADEEADRFWIVLGSFFFPIPRQIR